MQVLVADFAKDLDRIAESARFNLLADFLLIGTIRPWSDQLQNRRIERLRRSRTASTKVSAPFQDAMAETETIEKGSRGNC